MSLFPELREPIDTPEKRAAEAIDKHYDAMLVDGMDPRAAIEVERQRQAAHDDLTNQIMRRALGQSLRPERW